MDLINEINKKRILVICAANYCRSPVAQQLLKYYHNRYELDSAGIFNFNRAGMDPRSLKFLKKYIKNPEFHNTKKVTKKLIDSNDLIYAIDFKILMELNKLFPKSSKKFKLFGVENQKIMITDPYQMDEISYERIMEKINYICKEISLDI